MTTSEIATVLAWHDALNARDFDTLLALSSEDIEIGDAGGAGQGHAALLQWAQASDSTVEPGRMYVHDGVVVVEQRVTPAETNAATDSGAAAGSDGGTAVASAFRVVRDHITSVFRHNDLASALAATDLTEQDLTG
ncbi:MAG: nuclear transport factor 2 family protein [Actinobacteria bacterium]|nr:nuclear transport factor 2 family protein [Actinomycetota bacterium]